MLKGNVMSSGTAHTLGETLYAEALCDFMFTLQALSWLQIQFGQQQSLVAIGFYLISFPE